MDGIPKLSVLLSYVCFIVRFISVNKLIDLKLIYMQIWETEFGEFKDPNLVISGQILKS